MEQTCFKEQGSEVFCLLLAECLEFVYLMEYKARMVSFYLSFGHNLPDAFKFMYRSGVAGLARMNSL